MAEVAELHLPEDVLLDEEEIETLDSVPYWSSFFDQDDMYPYDPDPDHDEFSPCPSDFDHSEHSQVIFDEEEREGCLEIVGSEGSESDSAPPPEFNYFTHQDHHQVNFCFDLFDRCEDGEQTHVVGRNDVSLRNPFSVESGFRMIVDENDEMGSNYLELGLGFGLGVDRLYGGGNGGNGENGGFMVEGYGREFYVNRREETGESSGMRVVEPVRDGLRAVGIGSDSDEEEGDLGCDFHSEGDDDLDGRPDDMGLPLCWDCLRLEDRSEPNEEFEWEEVDERVDEREVLNMVIDADEERSVSTEFESGEVGEDNEAAISTLEWEVLLAVNNLERNSELEADHEGYIYPAEYDMLFGQFAENESSIRGSPPASKAVVNNLPSVIVSGEDLRNQNAVCAVCKDDISKEEQVKKLPCSHYYHGDCIIPWLSIRNTCPVCRYELATDDPDYERLRNQRAGHGVSSNTQVRYDIQISPQH